MASNRLIRIQYLEHSAFLCETDRRLLLLDIGRVPARSKDVDPDWDRLTGSGKPILLLSSHDHADHFDPAWQRLCERTAGCRFIAGDFGRTGGSTIRVNPGEDRLIDDFRIHSVAATDKGIAALLQFPEITIYYGGDHAIWDDLPEFRKPYRTSLDRLARTGLTPDVAFLPVSTSDGWQEDALIEGCRLLMTRLAPRGVVPMHAHGYEHFYASFADKTADLGIPVAPIRRSGDCLDFDGSVFLPVSGTSVS